MVRHNFYFNQSQRDLWCSTLFKTSFTRRQPGTFISFFFPPLQSEGEKSLHTYFSRYASPAKTWRSCTKEGVVSSSVVFLLQRTTPKKNIFKQGHINIIWIIARAVRAFYGRVCTYPVVCWGRRTSGQTSTFPGHQQCWRRKGAFQTVFQGTLWPASSEARCWWCQQ